MGTGKLNAVGNPAMDKHPIQGGVAIFLITYCYRNQVKRRPDGPLGLPADLTYSIYLKIEFKTIFIFSSQ